MKLEAQELVLRHGSRNVVDGVSLVVGPGDIVVIVGPNGSGKSTLLRGLARLHRPASGRVLLGGRDIRGVGSKEVARSLAILPQSPDAGLDLTARELIWRGRYPHQGLLLRPTRKDAEAVAWAMDACNVHGFADRPLAELSGGERQRAWLGLALAQQPSVLLLDEPTSFLDLSHQLVLMDIVRRLAQTGMAIAAVLHDLTLAARYATRVIAMRDGRVAFAGRPVEEFRESALEAVFGVRIRVIEDPLTGGPLPVPTGVLPLSSGLPGEGAHHAVS